MLVIKVWCLPKQPEENYRLLHQALVKTICGFPQTGVREEGDMLCLFPEDLMKYGLGSEILTEVTGLPDTFPKDGQQRRYLALSLSETVKDFYPDARVFCRIPANQENDVWWNDE